MAGVEARSSDLTPSRSAAALPRRPVFSFGEAAADAAGHGVHGDTVALALDEYDGAGLAYAAINPPASSRGQGGFPWQTQPMPLSATDLAHLRTCVDLAREALEDGDEPFGSVLVGPDGTVLYADRNRVKDGDQTRHPEFDIARWAGEHVAPADRPACTVYTSGEHCPMCSAAHAWVGLGRIVYAASTAQLTEWLTIWGVPPGPVRPLSIQEVAPRVPVDGPAPELEAEVRELHHRLHR
jgi:tRNA(Arg) A34 adenosine deaminase TadA